MPSTSQQKLQQIRAAEGYLELGSMFEGRWTLDLPLRTVMADSAIFSLQQIESPKGHRSLVDYLQGQAHRMAERYEQAIPLFESSLAADPENLHTLLATAWCYKRLNDLPRAIKTMEQAIVAEPTSAIAHYNLACYLALDQQVTSCVDRLAEALDLNHEFAQLIAQESDFDSVRNHPDFESLTGVWV